MPDDKFDYQRYLASREWAVLREQVRERSDNRCERCFVLPQAAVHHVTYERVGHEDLDDLLAVCGPCHQFVSAKGTFDPVEFMYQLRCASWPDQLAMVAEAWKLLEVDLVIKLVVYTLQMALEEAHYRGQHQAKAEKEANRLRNELHRAEARLDEAKLLAGGSVTYYKADGTPIELSGDDGLAEVRKHLS